MKKAVFIDRDGILNELITRHLIRTPRTTTEFKIIPGAVFHLQKLKDAGLLIIVTTHQPGLSDGSIDRAVLDKMHKILRTCFVMVDDILVCRHKAEDTCTCCPPASGLFEEARSKYSVTLHNCFAVSTRWQEMKAIKRVGGIPIQIESSRNAKKDAMPTVKNFEEAVQRILYLDKKNNS